MCGIRDQIITAITPTIRKYNFISHEHFFAVTINVPVSIMHDDAKLALHEIIQLSILTSPGMLSKHLGYRESYLRNLEGSKSLQVLLNQ